MLQTTRLQMIRTGFMREFWVANVLELFERFAYYASKAVLAVYVAEQVGLGPEKAGWLVGSLFNTLLYFLPPLAGTFVDRYGFRRSLMACFAIFCIGYFLIGMAGLPPGAGDEMRLVAASMQRLALLVHGLAFAQVAVDGGAVGGLLGLRERRGDVVGALVE